MGGIKTESSHMSHNEQEPQISQKGNQEPHVAGITGLCPLSCVSSGMCCLPATHRSPHHRPLNSTACTQGSTDLSITLKGNILESFPAGNSVISLL